MSDTHALACRALLREKIHLEHRTPAQLAALGGDGGSEQSAWAPAVALAELLLPFPAEMLTWWAAEPTGHVLIGDVSSVYQLGPTQVRGRSLTNVARVASHDLSHAHVAVFSALANLFDHLLGCAGEMEGAWLSEEGGITLHWQEVGQRVSELSRLGYAPHEAAGSPRDYFAWGMALYCTDRRTLNVADPRIERLLRTTVMNGEFWRQERGRWTVGRGA